MCHEHTISQGDYLHITSAVSEMLWNILPMCCYHSRFIDEKPEIQKVIYANFLCWLLNSDSVPAHPYLRAFLVSVYKSNSMTLLLEPCLCVCEKYLKYTS